MSTVTDVLHNEVSHIGNLFGQMGSNPLKTIGQFALGAADPLSAKLWSGVTGTHLTPLVGQFGGETNAQFAQSQSQGVNTGTSQMLGHVADAVAAAWGSYGLASGGAGAAAGLGGDGAAAGGGVATADGGAALPADVSVGTTGAGGSTAGAAGSGSSSGSLLGNLTLAQKAELGMSALSLAKTAMTPAPSLAAPAPVSQLPQGPESQGASAAQAMMGGAGQAGGAPGVAQTLLTGAGGVDPSTIGLGKNTLLGS
jgi:hypothetical protein